MSWWYPKKSRADELTRRLQGLEEVFSEGLAAGTDQLAHLSQRLEQALERSDFPRAQISRWIWIASQYRLSAVTEPKVAALAAAALVFLEEALECRVLGNDDHRELNWILETAIGHLAPHVGPAHLQGCLSDEELRLIDERLSSYDDAEVFDVDSVVLAVRRQLAVLEKFGSLGDWASLSAKTDTLIAAARRRGRENAPARAALRYLAELHDVVTDNVGVLGLIDDIYVLEWAYAAVQKQTLCLPILEAMSGRWSFVAMPGLGARGAQLDRFGRYIVCAALRTLTDASSGALVLRETGPYPVIAAVAAAVAAVRAQAHAFQEEMELWDPGCPVTIGDGTVSFPARWGGAVQGTARPSYRLHVANAGSISVGEEVLPYLARAPREWKRLANGTHILTWLKDRYVDELIGLTGVGRRRPSRYEAVLLLTSRAKLDRYLSALRPQGLTPAALLGACWVNGQGCPYALPGSATDRPLLYACSDVGVAADLLSDPPQHINGWQVLVDGAAPGRTLHAALAASGRLDDGRFCVFAQLHEREGVSALLQQGLEEVWYLEDQDVEVPPKVHPGKSAETDPLARFLARRSGHWPAAYSVRVGDDTFLDAAAKCLRQGNARRSDDPALDSLDLTVAAFLRRATAHPLPDDSDCRELEVLATKIVRQASMLAVYEPYAAEVRALFTGFAADVSGCDRREALLDLAASFGADEAVAVVCRSTATANRCRATAETTAALRGLEWTTIEALRASAPYDRVVVPGWLGRHTMRELSNIGFGAHTDMLLLPFERRWYERTISAGRHWERRIKRSTSELLKQIMDGGLTTESRWHEQAVRRVELETANNVEEIDDTPETAQAEARAVEGIRRAIPPAAYRNESSNAQLVLFTDPGAFALLPPAGHIIVLPEGHDTPTDDGGERRLLTPVAALAPGMLTALPVETDRDLVDAWADRLLSDGGALRARANLWKVALKRHFATTGESYARFASRMKEAGEPRDAQTIRSWANDTRSIAPRSYRRVLPLMADLMNDAGLRASLEDTANAIEEIYRVRAAAADAIIREIFSGAIDLSQPMIVFEVEGRRVVYALARVERLGGIQEVPSELVGRQLRLADLPAHHGGTV